MEQQASKKQALEWVKRHDYPRLPSKGHSYRATTGGFGSDEHSKPFPLKHHTLTKTLEGKFIISGD